MDTEAEVAIPRTQPENPTLLPEVRDDEGGDADSLTFGSGGSRRRATARAIEEINDLVLPRTKTSNAQYAGRAGAHQVQADHAAAELRHRCDRSGRPRCRTRSRREENSGVYVIPIDDEDYIQSRKTRNRRSPRSSSSRPPTGSSSIIELDDIAELDLEDIEEIPLPAPRVLGHCREPSARGDAAVLGPVAKRRSSRWSHGSQLDPAHRRRGAVPRR